MRGCELSSFFKRTFSEICLMNWEGAKAGGLCVSQTLLCGWCVYVSQACVSACVGYRKCQGVHCAHVVCVCSLCSVGFMREFKGFTQSILPLHSTECVSVNI